MSPQNKQFYRDDHLFVDLRNRVVTLDSETLTLTSVEYRLLALLVQHAGEIVPRPILLTHIWGYVPRSRTLDRRYARPRDRPVITRAGAATLRLLSFSAQRR